VVGAQLPIKCPHKHMTAGACLGWHSVPAASALQQKKHRLAQQEPGQLAGPSSRPIPLGSSCFAGNPRVCSQQGSWGSRWRAKSQTLAELAKLPVCAVPAQLGKLSRPSQGLPEHSQRQGQRSCGYQTKYARGAGRADLW
jgi:hypothetical protein